MIISILMQYQKESKNEKKKKAKRMHTKQRHKTNIYWSEMPPLPSPPSSLQY